MRGGIAWFDDTTINEYELFCSASGFPYKFVTAHTVAGMTEVGQ